ncbi:MAG TPA: 1-acyl-sn-glycerol-3-phosphate acyltransferase [Spirochaetia bacterium]|nr:1-acyl-sn-glycerol-3-phosphate acyltransferase [Spirochaetia bacterium]
MTSEFDDIRPYNDNELGAVMERLSKNKWLVSGARNVLWPGCPPFLKPLVDIPVRRTVRQRLLSMRTIDEFQRKIILGEVLERIIQKTTDGLTVSGTERLSRDKSYIYISNHRDITLDSAFLNYLLDAAGLKIAEIAFGDNLLVNDFVADLIRINRGIIVKRNLPAREQVKALYHLSRYIWHTTQKGSSVWLAQREGRAKDGNDETNPAIIKMLYLSRREQGESFAQFMKQVNIVPVVISYELDPCDRMKAWELYRKHKRGSHKKRKNEDLVSMFAGLTGYKGRVHFAFADPLDGAYENEKAVAAAIDQEIFRLYRQWPSNYIAYDTVTQTARYRDKYSVKEMIKFLKRFKGLSEPVKSLAYSIYANSVKNQVRAL